MVLWPTTEARPIQGLSLFHSWLEGKFFFLGIQDGWGFSTAWGEPYLDANKDDNVSDANWNDFRVLKDSVVPTPSVLLSEQNLFGAGLSPINSLGGRGRHHSPLGPPFLHCFSLFFFGA